MCSPASSPPAGSVARRRARTPRRRAIGLVPQSDTLLPFLSVREALAFAGELWASPGDGGARARARVDALLRELGLAGVAATRVGSSSARGVSGGERKRAAIGAEAAGRA